MKKASNDILATEEFITIIKSIGKLVSETRKARETLFNKKSLLTEANLTWVVGCLEGAVSNLSILISAIDPESRSSVYFEKISRKYPTKNFYSIQDLRESLLDIKVNFLATKLAYSETFEHIKPLVDAVESSLELAAIELENANKSHKL